MSSSHHHPPRHLTISISISPATNPDNQVELAIPIPSAIADREAIHRFLALLNQHMNEDFLIPNTSPTTSDLLTVIRALISCAEWTRAGEVGIGEAEFDDLCKIAQVPNPLHMTEDDLADPQAEA